MIVPVGCENNSVRYCSASIPLACAVAMIEYSAAVHIAPFVVLLNSQLFRPTANGRIAFSARLLSIGTLPFFRNVYRYGFSCRASEQQDLKQNQCGFGIHRDHHTAVYIRADVCGDVRTERSTELVGSTLASQQTAIVKRYDCMR